MSNFIDFNIKTIEYYQYEDIDLNSKKKYFRQKIYFSRRIVNY